MAVLKNTSFVGVNLLSVEPEAIIRLRDFATAQADLAGTFAHLTDNTEAGHIDHSGPGRGCVLGIPLANQCMRRNLGMDAGTAKNGGVAAGDVIWFPYLVRVPPGESMVRVDVIANINQDMGRNFRARCFAFDDYDDPMSAAGDEFPLEFTGRTLANAGLYQCDIPDVAPGLWIVALAINATNPSAQFTARVREFEGIFGVTIRFPRDGIPARIEDGDPSNPARIYPPFSSQAVVFQQMDDGAFNETADLPINGYHVNLPDANANGLLEYLRAAPVGPNADYTHTESARVNPTRDRFRAFTRKTFANEPIPIIPVASHNFGGIKQNGGYLVEPRALVTDSPTASEQERNAFAPYFASSGIETSPGVNINCVCAVPDLPSGVLRWAVLIAFSDTGKKAAADFEVRMQMEGNTISGAVVPTTIANLPSPGAQFAVATGTALAFSRDSSNNRMRVFLHHTGGGAYIPADCAIVAAAVWVEE